MDTKRLKRFLVRGALLVFALLSGSVVFSAFAARFDGPGSPTNTPLQVTQGKICNDKQDCRPAVLVDGYVSSDFADRLFAQVQSKHLRGEWICFNSPGGNSKAAWIMSETLHKSGLKTCVVPIQKPDGSLAETGCHSACSTMFFSGNERLIGAGGVVGIHSARICNQWYCGPANWLTNVISNGFGWLVGYITDSIELFANVRAAANKVHWREIHLVTKNEFVRWKAGPAANFGEPWRFIATK